MTLDTTIHTLTALEAKLIQAFASADERIDHDGHEQQLEGMLSLAKSFDKTRQTWPEEILKTAAGLSHEDKIVARCPCRNRSTDNDSLPVILRSELRNLLHHALITIDLLKRNGELINESIREDVISELHELLITITEKIESPWRPNVRLEEGITL